jgi:hypothetical protein
MLETGEWWNMAQLLGADEKEICECDNTAAALCSVTQISVPFSFWLKYERDSDTL